MAKLQERTEMDSRYMWDLSTLFENDEAFEQAFLKVDPLAEQAASFEGKLKDAKTVKAFLDVSVSLEVLLSDLFCYANIRYAEDTRQEKAQSMRERIYAKYVQAQAALSFSDPELLALPEETLSAVAKDPALSEFSYQFEKLLRKKPHTLSAAEERLLAGLGEVLAAPGQIAQSLRDADMVFHPAKDGEGNRQEVTNSGFILQQMSKDRVLRENVFRSYYGGYKHHINTYASAYAGAVKGAVAEAAARKYASSRELYMADENIPASVYDNLIASVHKYMPLMYRYLALRKRILGIPELHYYDVYTPLAEGTPASYTYEEAQELVLKAVAPLGEEYVNTVKGAFRDRWIDVYPNKGKRSGAFSTGTYHSNPFILTNFVGTLDSVSTIAHEMGHSMHTWYSNHHQKSWNADYTIFVAEVASTVNENLLVEQLLSECQDPVRKMALLNEYLEGFKGTVYRQTMFAEFEKEAHAMAERGEALNASSLSALYGRLIREYFGPDLVIDEEVTYEWARIPHFYTPFYVYKYATSYAAAVAISEEILKEGKPAADRFLRFLSLGGSMDPLEELKCAGADLTRPESVDRALEKFERVLAEAEKLV